MDERDERKRTSDQASKDVKATSKPGSQSNSGKGMAGTYLLAMRCPVYRRRDSHSGFRTELENLTGDVKGKGTSGETARPKLPMRRLGADCSIVVMKRGNARGAKGAGHRRWERANWQQEELQFSTEGGGLRSVARAG
jgi:hypothetical protein